MTSKIYPLHASSVILLNCPDLLALLFCSNTSDVFHSRNSLKILYELPTCIAPIHKCKRTSSRQESFFYTVNRQSCLLFWSFCFCNTSTAGSKTSGQTRAEQTLNTERFFSNLVRFVFN